MGLALVVVEEDAGRAMHLTDDDALGAVDHESAVGRHQGHVAHVDVLLLDVANRPKTGFFLNVEDAQSQSDLQRSGKRHAALLALFHVVLRLLQLVAHKVEHGAVGEVLDRENGPEHLLQAHIGAALGRDVHLKEVIVGAPLHLNEVGHAGYLGNPPEALANTLTSRKGFGHGCPSRLIRFVRP